MVSVFVNFPPLGIVLVALLGVGVAEHVGFLNAGLKAMLNFTPRALVTPMLILVACLSHTATDAGYVLVIPLGGVIFYTMGRHPLAGIAAAFAGVSGGFSAKLIPSGIDPLLQGFTQSAAQLIDPARQVNPLANYYFTAASTLLIMGLGWFITNRIIEPRLAATPVDGDTSAMPTLEPLAAAERRGLAAGLATMALGFVLLTAWAVPGDSALRAPTGELTAFAAPIMRSIVPLIFLLFLFPAVAYGVAAGTVKTAKDVVGGMTKSMSTMGYYIVMAFFAALFTDAFGRSNIGPLRRDGPIGWRAPGAIVNWFGITDVWDVVQGANTRGYGVRWFAGVENKAEVARRASPMTYVRPGLPPIITIHGDADPTVPYAQAVALKDGLSRASSRRRHGAPDRRSGSSRRQSTCDSARNTAPRPAPVAGLSETR